MVVKIVDPMGTEFDSIVSLCSFWGVSVKDFYQGASQGLSMDECLKYALDCVAPTGGTEVAKSKKQLSTGKIVTDHTGQEFPSVNAMCEHWGVSANVFDYRFKVKKLSLEKSLTNKLRKRKGVYDHLGQEFSSASEMCKHWGVRFTTYKRRLKTGYSLEEALTKGRYEERRVLSPEGKTDTRKEKAVKVSKTGKLKDKNLVKTRSVVDHLGNSYPSISAMCEAYGVNYCTYKNRIKCGWSVESALVSKINEVVDHKGNTYKSVREMCNVYGISDATFYTRRKAGYTLAGCLLGLHKRLVVDHLGNTYPTFKAMCDAYGLPSYLVRARLDRFKFSLEAALTTPKNEMGSTFREKAQRREGVSFKKRGIFDSRPIMVDENE